MVYEDNLKMLKNEYRILYDAISSEKGMELPANVHIEAARKEGNVVVYHDHSKDIYLNSQYNPYNEANRYMAEYFDMPDESICIMFGLSNGYYADAYIKNAKENTKCIIYEPSKEIFIEVIKHIDIKNLLSSDRIYIVVEGINDENLFYIMDKWLQIYNVDYNKIVCTPKYDEIFYDSHEMFLKKIQEIYEKFYAFKNTEVIDGKQFVKNGIKNMVFFPGCRSGAELQDIFPEDMPAVVVSSGPSLEKNIELLKEIKGKAFIFATDSAVKNVVAQGINPDAMITIDPNKSVDNFMVKDVETIPLFVEMYAKTEILEYVKPKNLFFFSSDSILWSRLFREVGSKILNMPLGGSVATAAIANLIIWGFKKIILIGQDLAFTGNRIHAGEAEVEINTNDSKYTTVKDINEEDAPIRKDYYIYLKWIENIAFNYKDIEFIDATEGGAKKKYVKQMTFREAIDKYCTKNYSNISDILLSVPRLFEGKDKQLVVDAFSHMQSDFINMQRQLLTCRDDCLNGKEILRSREINIDELKRINESIKRTDELIEDSDETAYIKKYVAGLEAEMMSDMYQEEKDDIKEAIRMYEKSRKYYDGILKILPELIELVDEGIRNID
ncbi:MAG: DUF115 domain-containing protein [Clostridium sp.]|nr:DUF115 domain-containing protein [Clostridium sp.]